MHPVALWAVAGASVGLLGAIICTLVRRTGARTGFLSCLILGVFGCAGGLAGGFLASLSVGLDPDEPLCLLLAGAGALVTVVAAAMLMNRTGSSRRPYSPPRLEFDPDARKSRVKKVYTGPEER